MAAHHPAMMLPDEIDGEAHFVPVAQAYELRISRRQRASLRLAVGAPADTVTG